MDDIFKEGYLEEILPAVRKQLGILLFFYLPHQKEGGNMAASLLQYKELVKEPSAPAW